METRRNIDSIKLKPHIQQKRLPSVRIHSVIKKRRIVTLGLDGAARVTPAVVQPAVVLRQRPKPSRVRRAKIVATQTIHLRWTVVTRRFTRKLARVVRHWELPKFQFAAYQKLTVPLMIFVVLVSFGGGMAVALRTPRTVADAQVSGPAAGGVVASLGAMPSSLTDAQLFTTPIGVLQNYLAAPATTTPAQPSTVAVRTAAIQQYLQAKKSPLAVDSSLIAEQSNWKLILAISFAESTMGKNCYDFNCSGIGGSSEIKSYDNFSSWIVDFNHLLDKHYNNWTLQQMCGVYVQPCTQSWLNATGQVLDELQAEGIN